mgnify:CR=1 FL=1
MAENTHPTPGTSAGYAAEGRELERDSLKVDTKMLATPHKRLPTNQAIQK